MKSNGSERSVLINESGDQTDPDWSRDGTTLLYTSYQDGNEDVYAASLLIESPPPPSSTPQFHTRNVFDDETKENISRLTILGVVFVLFVLLFFIRRFLKGIKRS